MEGRIKKRRFSVALVVSALLAVPQWAVAQPIWTDRPAIATQAKNAGASITRFSRVRRVAADKNLLQSALAKAPMEKTESRREQVQLPMPDGSLSSFYIVESPVMADALARRYPEIKTYKVSSAVDGAVTGRLDMGPQGFHAYINTPAGVVYIDPEPVSETEDLYNSYYKKDYSASSRSELSCGVSAKALNTSPVGEFAPLAMMMARTSNELLTYRIAVATTGEYSQAVAGGNAGNTLAQVVTAINRINQIYERDLAIRLELVANNDWIIFTNPLTDGYDNSNPGALLATNQQKLDTIIGSAGYDIGHVFSTDGGGLASFGVVCEEGFKAQGETGFYNPVGDPFYIDLVAHEIGHQFGASHSFNGTTSSCGSGNRYASTAFEPGSGTTIMAYAGICGAEDIANSSDATFHAGSIEQILNYLRSGVGNTCGSATNPTGNTAPIVNAGLAYTIPARTPFSLTGSATDINGDALIYQWDEMDLGSATNDSTLGTDRVSNPLFRSFEPVSSPERTFPLLSKILDGSNGDKAETLPTQNRALKFRLTARDGKGGVDENDVTLTVDGNSGPFKVLQPDTAVTLDSAQQQVIEWNTACTDMAPVSCSNVDILLSTDDGVSFPVLLADDTFNDGVEAVNIPPQTAVNARIKIACSDNIFFDISNQSFSLENGSGQILVITGVGGDPNCNVPNTITLGGDDKEPNDFIEEAQLISVPFSVSGGVNDVTDRDDFYEFTAAGGAVTITLNNFGGNSFALYLLDSSGSQLAESNSQSGLTAVISRNLSRGQTYYIHVNGLNTSGKDVLYTLDVKSSLLTSSGGGGGISFWLAALLMITLWFRITSVPRRKLIRYDRTWF